MKQFSYSKPASNYSVENHFVQFNFHSIQTDSKLSQFINLTYFPSPTDRIIPTCNTFGHINSLPIPLREV